MNQNFVPGRGSQGLQTRADYALAVGAQVDEGLARDLRTACEEFRQISDRILNTEAVNALLQSDLV